MVIKYIIKINLSVSTLYDNVILDREVVEWVEIIVTGTQE